MTVYNQRHPSWQEVQFIKSDGTVYNLHSPPTRAVLNMTGWGKPPEQRQDIRGPFQHGQTVVSYRLQPRIIALDLVHKYCSRSELYRGRSKLLEQMGLNNAPANAPEPGVLRWRYIQNGQYLVRDLDVYLSAGLLYQPLDGWRERSIHENVEFFAPNPIIYDPTPRSSVINTFDLQLKYPVTFPFILGASIGIVNVTYGGTWESFPDIVITGPSNPVYIENVTTGRFIRFNYAPSTGETVTFRLAFNEKSVTNQLGEDLLPYISNDSDMGNFSLQPAPLVAGGVNVFRVVMIGPMTGSTITFNYFNRYYGI